MTVAPRGPHHHFCSTKNTQPWPARVDTLGVTHRRVTSLEVPVHDCDIDEGNRICLEHNFLANPSCWAAMASVHKAFFISCEGSGWFRNSKVIYELENYLSLFAFYMEHYHESIKVDELPVN